MSRALPAVLLVPALALAAPRAKEREAAAYFPTREGDKREYEVRAGDKVEGGYTDVVTKVEKRDGAPRVTITRDYPGSAPYVTTIAVAADGLSRVAVGDKPLDKPAVLLRLPAKVGTEWEYEGGGARYKVVEADAEVEVPAGKYKAVRVELGADGAAARTTLWFAPSVGLVKMVGADGDRVTVLKSFTPSK
jgi:hypothetical protein